MKLNAPYLILIGAEKDPTYAKTGFGLVQWRPELVAGQLRFSGCRVDLSVPDISVEEAASKGVRSLIIGVAPIGGIIPDEWWDVIIEAANQGLDIVNGLHIKLKDHPKVVHAASKSGSRLIDVRVPPPNLPVGTGIKRTGRRLLTVATDCACGKKYTALALDKAMREAGMNSTFCATGQTGIMIVGEGIPIDAVPADFISGAAEMLSPDNSPDHWDVIEGQGSLFHPGYAGVSLGLLHGSQPDTFVVCHDATRNVLSGWEHYPLPSIPECIDLHSQVGRRTNPNITCVGVSINTFGLPTNTREEYLKNLRTETGLPCIDPLVEGCGDILDNIRNKFDIL
ncbi:MAG: DUF1611 domain-containing protein [Candidatus Marinimicrobia bacterium]|nr:DUF1611 domain-containing protein [Candidatus Neomarinimicrobiota bacterium]